MVSHRSLSRNGQHCGRTLPQRQSPTGPHRQKAPQCEDRHLFSAATVIRSRQSFRPDRCGLLRPRAEAQFPASRPCDRPIRQACMYQASAIPPYRPDCSVYYSCRSRNAAHTQQYKRRYGFSVLNVGFLSVGHFICFWQSPT